MKTNTGTETPWTLEGNVQEDGNLSSPSGLVKCGEAKPIHPGSSGGHWPH